MVLGTLHIPKDHQLHFIGSQPPKRSLNILLRDTADPFSHLPPAYSPVIIHEIIPKILRNVVLTLMLQNFNESPSLCFHYLFLGDCVCVHYIRDESLLLNDWLVTLMASSKRSGWHSKQFPKRPVSKQEVQKPFCFERLLYWVSRCWNLSLGRSSIIGDITAESEGFALGLRLVANYSLHQHEREEILIKERRSFKKCSYMNNPRRIRFCCCDSRVESRFTKVAQLLGRVNRVFLTHLDVFIDVIEQPLMIDGPTPNHNHIGPNVILVMIVRNHIPGDRPHIANTPQNGQPHLVIPIGPFMRNLNGRLHGPTLLRLDQLREYGVPLVLHISRPIQTIREHIPQHIHRLLLISVEDSQRITGDLPRCVGVEITADLLHLELEVLAAASRGAFEMEVLEEMGGTGGLLGLVAAPAFYEHGDCGQLAGQKLGRDRYAAWQFCYFCGQGNGVLTGRSYFMLYGIEPGLKLVRRETSMLDLVAVQKGERRNSPRVFFLNIMTPQILIKAGGIRNYGKEDEKMFIFQTVFYFVHLPQTEGSPINLRNTQQTTLTIVDILAFGIRSKLYQRMGAAKPAKYHIIIIDDTFKLLDRYPQYTQAMDSNPDISYQIFDKIETVFQTQTQSRLRNIIIRYQLKDQMLRYRLRHHLTNTKLYILTSPHQPISQQDYDNAYITLIDSDFDKLLTHILTNQQTEIYMPLIKMNRELQKKINVKLVCGDEEVVEEFKGYMDGRNLSYMVFENTEAFKDSIVWSVSDYIVCTRICLERVVDIVKFRFKKTKLICYVRQLDEKIPYEIEYNFSAKMIVDHIAEDKRKLGYRTEKIKLIHILKRADQLMEEGPLQRREKAIKAIRQNYPKIKFEEYSDQQKLIADLSQLQYSAVLFVENRTVEINDFRRLLHQHFLSKRVQVMVLHNPSYQKKVEQFNGLEKSFMLEQCEVKSIDWINKHLSTDHLDIHKKDIFENGIQVREYLTAKDYIARITNCSYDISPVIMCVAQQLNQLENFLVSQNVNKTVKIVCFDNMKNVNLVTRQKVFEKTPYYWFSSNNIKKIIEEVTLVKCEYLVTDYVSSQKQTDSYLVTKQKFQQITKNNYFKMRTSAFPNNDITSLYKEEVNFILFDSLGESINRETKISSFLEKLVGIWRIGYNPIKDIKMVKKQIIDMLIFMKKCDSLSVEVADFQTYYIRAIEQCETLSQLAHAAVHIWSLPHGLAQIINRVFSQFENNIKLLRVFSSYIFCLFLNYCNFFEQRYMQKFTLKIYVEDEIDQQKFKIGDVLYNTNFLNCINMDEYSNSTKNYLLIDYEFCPLKEFSFYSNLLFIQPYSFYKEAVEYMFAPYSKFVIQGIEEKGSVKVMRLKNAKNYNKTDIVRMFLQENLGLNMTEILSSALHEQKIQNILVTPDQMQQKQRSLAYQQFIDNIKKKRFLMAEHKYLLAENEDQENISFKMIRKIEKAWLYLMQGRYNEAKKTLNSMTISIQTDVKIIKEMVQNLIQAVIHQRKSIFDGLKTNSYWVNRFVAGLGWKMQSKPIKWTSKYFAERDQFALQQQGKVNSFIVTHNRTQFNQKPDETVFSLEEQKIYEQINVQQLRNQIDRFNKDQIHYESNKMAVEILLGADEQSKIPMFSSNQAQQLRRTSSLHEPLGAPALSKHLSLQGILSKGIQDTRNKAFENRLVSIEQQIPTIKWFCLYVDGAFKIARQDNTKKLKIKKKKKKTVSNFQWI